MPLKKTKKNIHQSKINKSIKNKILRGGFISDSFKDYLIEKNIELEAKVITDGSTPLSQDYSRQIKENMDKVIIINNPSIIKQIYERYGYLELRPYNGEKKLIIACGNTRFDFDYLYTAENTDNRVVRTITSNKYHSHWDAYTIDMHLGANPSILGTWDADTFFRTIPDNSFDLILFEGGGEPSDNDAEIQRLLNKNSVSFCIAQLDKVYSYYYEGDYTITNSQDAHYQEGQHNNYNNNRSEQQYDVESSSVEPSAESSNVEEQ